MTNKCIIPKKRCDIQCHTAFYIYKYRLNGNALLCKDRANQEFFVFIIYIV